MTPRAGLRSAKLLVGEGYPISEVPARLQRGWPTVPRWVERYRAGASRQPAGSWPDRKTPERFDARELAVRAVHVLDKEGLGALTMRRMATEMGVAATSSLYWRVRDKEDLLRLALDEVYAEAAGAMEAAGGLRAVATRSLKGLLDHPWCAPLLATQPASGPGAARYSEVLLASLARAGVPETHRGAALAALGFYLLGAGQQLIAWRAAGAPTDVPAAGDGTLLAGYLAHASLDLASHVGAGLELIIRAVVDGPVARP